LFVLLPVRNKARIAYLPPATRRGMGCGCNIRADAVSDPERSSVCAEPGTLVIADVRVYALVMVMTTRRSVSERPCCVVGWDSGGSVFLVRMRAVPFKHSAFPSAKPLQHIPTEGFSKILARAVGLMLVSLSIKARCFCSKTRTKPGGPVCIVQSHSIFALTVARNTLV